MRKRGAKPKAHAGEASDQIRRPSINTPSIALSPKSASARSGTGDRNSLDVNGASAQNDDSPKEWSPPMLVEQAIVVDLTEIYFEVVYPVFPLYHRPTLSRRVARGEYLRDRAFYASVMAMCALSSARARDGALYSPDWDVKALAEPSAESFFKAAVDALPKDEWKLCKFDHLRACVLLAICSIQLGNAIEMNYYLGIYNTLVAVGQLHDEANWPSGIGIIEIEERRRLLWSTYTLDVFSSIIWDRPILSREVAFNVNYPTEVDDESFTNAGYSQPSPNMTGNGCSWMKGWNFITDLYRILEHTVDNLRCLRSSAQRPLSVQTVFSDTLPSQRALFEHIISMYNSLPAPFRSTRPIQCKLGEDLFSFQAANIAATVQLVRMVHLTNDRSPLSQKCQVASEVIAGFAAVPVAYLRAMGSPLLHHLAGIGTMLGAAFQDGLSETSYNLIRSVLLDLANLLANLEVDLFCPSGTSEKLRTQVSRIDEYMHTQRLWLMTHFDNGQAVGTFTHAEDGTLPEVTTSARTQLSPLIAAEESPQFRFPPELFEDWSWAFNFTA